MIYVAPHCLQIVKPKLTFESFNHRLLQSVFFSLSCRPMGFAKATGYPNRCVKDLKKKNFCIFFLFLSSFFVPLNAHP